MNLTAAKEKMHRNRKFVVGQVGGKDNRHCDEVIRNGDDDDGYRYFTSRYLLFQRPHKLIKSRI